MKGDNMKDVEFLKNNNVDIEKSLELFGDMETYNETIKEFQAGLPKKIEEIEKHFEQTDIENYTIYVHSLKSDCKYFGFTSLANMAYEHEMAGKAGNIEYIQDNYDSLMNEAMNVKEIVNQYIGVEDNTLDTNGSDIDEDIILVADDSEVIRIFVKKIFDANYEIKFATNGAEALEQIKEHEHDDRIKAILLDLNMPKVDGFTVLEYLKDQNMFDKMPVTIISGDSSTEAINKAFTFDIVDMITKPFSEDKIKLAVEKTIAQKKN